MKQTKKKKLTTCILLVFSAAICAFISLALLFPPAASARAEDKGSDFYWSEHSGPIFYGATGITLPEGADFDINDARFRTFAHDFEDGDLDVVADCPAIDTSVAGKYEIVYTAKDSHGNEDSLTVPVTVGGSDKITVARRLYTTPSDWNMTAAGFSRCNSGDRQILGIYLPEGASFEMRLCEGTPDLVVSMLNNDAYKETSVKLTSEEFAVLSNDYKENDPAKGKEPGVYACVPLVTTPKLARGEDISTVYDIEVRYGAEEAHPLNYYRFNDGGEDAFREKWRASGDEFAVIENRAITILLPIGDIEAFKRKEAGFVFKSYDEHLAYYAAVVDRMDKIVGLSYRPDRATDQNLRAKYLVKANAHGAGAAYYAGNHVGINNPSMGAFYQMNWGGLHELAHGYQGHLGSGTMGLGETSNNFLGHYIQMDKTLYTEQGDWLGKLADIEGKINAARLSGKKFNDFGETPQYKLYAIINLFDYFEGEETYARLFSYYRMQVDAKAMSSATPQQDIYALFFAEEYKTNIIPYWNQWGLETSESVQERVYALADKSISICADSAGEELDNIKDGEGLTLGYGLVEDGTLAKYGVCGNLTVRITSEEGGAVLLQKDGQTAYSAKVAGGEARFENIPAGSYMVRTPTDFGYDYKTGFCTVCEGENVYEVSYVKRESANYHPTTLCIKGIYGTTGFGIKLSDANKSAKLEFGAADVGNQGADWKARPQDTYISVTFSDSLGNERYSWSVMGGGYFCYLEDKIEQITLSYGDEITVFTYRPDLVKVLSAVDGKEIEEYNCPLKGLQTIKYTVTEAGLVPSFKQLDAASTLYAHIKDALLKELGEQAEYFAANPSSLETKYLQREKKAVFLEGYERLKEQDRAEFDALAAAIYKGGAPKVVALKDSVSARSFDEVDWGSCFSAYDNEDGNIPYGDSVKIITDNDGKGSYTAEIVVTDSDGNASSCTVKVTLVEKSFGIADIALIACGGVILVLAVIAAILLIRRKRASS